MPDNLFKRFRNSLAQAVAGDLIRTSTSAAVEAAVKEIREAAAGIDDDDYLYRRITSSQARDLSPLTFSRQLEVVHKLWLQNPLAKQLVRMFKNFTIGGGIKIEAKDKRVQAIIDEMFYTGESRLDLMLPRYAEVLSLTGELIFRPFVNSQDGRVRFAYIDSARVKEVRTDPDDIQTVTEIILPPILGQEKERVLKVIRQNKDGRSEGDCFFFRINNLPNGTRGNSDLLAVADWLDAYDQFLFQTGDRAAQLTTVVWDHEIEGGTPETLKEFKKENPTPTGMSSRYHNEKVKINAVTPDLKAADMATLAGVFRTQIIGGTGYPLHYFGDGSDANLATAREMGWPTLKMLEERQAYTKFIVETLVSYGIEQATDKRSSLKEAFGKEGVKDRSFTITMPELNTRDTQQGATSFQTVVTGLVAAKSQGWISDESAVGVICTMAENVGVTLDPRTEWEKARQSAKDADSKDYDGLPIEQIKKLLAKDPTITPEQVAAIFKARTGAPAPPAVPPKGPAPGGDE